MKTLHRLVAGFLNAVQKAAEAQPVLFAVVIVFLQTAFVLEARELWFSDEVRYAAVFQHLLQDGKALVLYLNGDPYPDKPPVYFWLLYVIYLIVDHTRPALFYLGAVVSGAIFVVCGYALGRTLLGKDKRTCAHAVLVLLSCFFIVGLLRYSRMDLLFASFIALCHLFLFKALESERSVKLWAAAGVLSGLAVLTKGPLGLVFPVVSALTYSLWRGTWRRLLRRDAAVGGLCLLGVLAAWLLGVVLAGELEYLRNIFAKQIYERAVKASHHPQPWYHYMLTLPAVWLPWTLVLLGAPWKRLREPDFYRNLKLRRKLAPAGVTYMWCAFLSGFVLLSLVSIKLPIYLLPLLPFAALLTVRGLHEMTDAGRRRVLVGVITVFVLFAVALPFSGVFLTWDVELRGEFLSAGAAVAAAVLVYLSLWRKGEAEESGKAAGRSLAAAVLGVTLFIQPVAGLLGPSVDPVLSPKAQAEVIAEYAKNGYYPTAYKIYSGIFDYYAGLVVHETDMPHKYPQIEKILQENPKAILAIRKKHWDPWPDRPQNLRLVHEQLIVNEVYYLAAQGGDPADDAAILEAAKGASSGEALSTEASSDDATSTKALSNDAPSSDVPQPVDPEDSAPDENKAPREGGDQEQEEAPASGVTI